MHYFLVLVFGDNNMLHALVVVLRCVTPCSLIMDGLIDFYLIYNVFIIYLVMLGKKENNETYLLANAWYKHFTLAIAAQDLNSILDYLTDRFRVFF